MGRKCTICAHKQIKEINIALVRPGAVLSTIAHQFALSEDALKRHVKGGHIPTTIAKAAHAHEAADADDLLDEIKTIQQHQRTIFKEAREYKRRVKTDEGIVEVPDPDNKLALEALRDQSKIIELKGKVLGSFKEKREQSGSLTLRFDKEDEGT